MQWPDHSNETLARQIEAALLDAARAKSEADRLERMAKRKLAELRLRADGKSADDREAWARTHTHYVDAENQYIEAASKANLARARADGLQIRFDEWRTEQATKRAEMNLV